MKLLHAKTRELRDFMSDRDIPPYAILSHTWGSNEATFQDWEALRTNPEKVIGKSGFRKIEYCCDQAARDGIDWVWVDTCCIDKKSSAELSEAINSMFRWYQNARICYAYLADVVSGVDPSRDELDASIARSRWFTRGWTLQELLAPRHVEFYSSDWKTLGSKEDLCNLLTLVTGIEKRFLCGEQPQMASIAKRMSWAAKRETSRIEDVAYSLLGIFDVNMPLLYGEGTKAFRRLQEEIMKVYPYDQSLFAWGEIVHGDPRELVDHRELAAPGQYDDPDDIAWDANEAEKGLHGLFAESPGDFASSAGIIPVDSAPYFFDPRHGSAHPFIVGKAVRIELGIMHVNDVKLWPRHLSPELKVVQLRGVGFTILLCNSSGSGGPTVVLPLVRWGMDFVGRVREVYLLPYPMSVPSLTSNKNLFHVESEKPYTMRRGDILLRRSVSTWDLSSGTYLIENSVTGYCSAGLGVMTIPEGVVGKLFLCVFYLGYYRDREIGFTVHFGREMCEEDDGDSAGIGRTTVAFSPHPLRITGRCPRGQCPQVNSGQAFYCAKHCPWPASNDAEYSHVMQPPEDTWQFEMAPFPPVKVRVRRTHTTSDPNTVFDLTDIMVRNIDASRNLIQSGLFPVDTDVATPAPDAVMKRRNSS